MKSVRPDSNHSLRVLHVNKNFSGTGAQRVSLQVLQRMDVQEKFFAADSWDQSSPKFRSDLRASNVHAIPLLGLANKNIWALPIAIINLWLFIRRHRINLLHSHSFVAGVAARIAAKLAGVPILHTFHGLPHQKYAPVKYQIIRAIERFLANWTHRVICVNAYYTETVFSGFPRDHVVSIYNFAPTPSSNKARTTRPATRFLFMGRFEFAKNPELFIESAAHCLATHPHLEFRMVGGGSLSKKIESLVNRLKCPIDVRGFSEDPTEHYQWADVVVLTSRFDAFPLIIGEALAQGCKVICPDISWIQKIWGTCVSFVEEGAIRQYVQAITNFSETESPANMQHPPELAETTFTKQYRALYQIS